MNIELQFKKSNLKSEPTIEIHFGDTVIKTQIKSLEHKLIMHDLKHDTDNELVVMRREDYLYNTQKTHHENKVIVEKVIVDDFWELGPDWYTPESVLDSHYLKHIEGIDGSEWIKNTLNHNTHLFFNGKLRWQIKYPVRRCFFKDVRR